MPFKKALENLFSWSKSRDEELKECRRKYFYNRYASWGGWDPAAPKLARDAYVLKNLKNRWAWKGETVHHEIEHVLKGLRAGRAVPPAAAQAHLTESMRRDYRSSKSRRYWDDPKRSAGLFEHEYAKEVSDEIWKRMHDESAACLKNFYESHLYAELLQDDPKTWLMIEDLEEFDFEGSKVFVKLDFARSRGDTVEIFDWKTGRRERGGGAGVQMGAYALFAMGRWKVPLEAIRGYLVYLGYPMPVPEIQPLSLELLEDTKTTMRESIARMRALLRDPAANEPLSMDRFAFTENVKLCDSCNFYKICEKWREAPLRGAL